MPKLPARRELATEFEAFMNRKAGRCWWIKTTHNISELFEGKKTYQEVGMKVDEVTMRWPVLVTPEVQAATAGERGRTRRVSPVRVERPKYGQLL